MAELPPVVPGEAIDSTTFGNPVIDRVLSRYADATERDALVPTPIAGDSAFLTDTGTWQVFDGTAWGSIVQAANGITAAPSVHGSNPNSGIWFRSNSTIFSVAGVQMADIGNGGALVGTGLSENPFIQPGDGTAAAPGYSFFNERATGLYRRASNSMGMACNGDDRLWIDPNGFYIRKAEPTGSAANTFLDGSNLVLKSTSARKYKTDIEPAGALKALELEPVTFHRDDDDDDYIGFIADDLADQDPRLGVYDADGEIENYDLRGVVAVLAAKVNDLEARLAVLEAS